MKKALNIIIGILMLPFVLIFVVIHAIALIIKTTVERAEDKLKDK